MKLYQYLYNGYTCNIFMFNLNQSIVASESHSWPLNSKVKLHYTVTQVSDYKTTKSLLSSSSK